MLWTPWSRSYECTLGGLAALTLILGGCGSGGGNMTLGPAAIRPAPAPLGPAQDPTGTSEFNRNDGLDIINAQAAYARGATGAGVIVAMIDTGIDPNHPDLANNISTDSYDIITNSHTMVDTTGHGTRVAGVIGAEQNGDGSHGVAFDSTLLMVDAYACRDSDCGYQYSDLAEAVNYATDRLAHVINMSLSGASGGSFALQLAMLRAANAGAFVVVATGNDDGSPPGYPSNTASSPAFGNRVVAVTATTDSGQIASFSNHCGAVMNNCLVAPGVGIATTRDGASSAASTTSGSGTSFAAPHVSGALALLIQLYPDAFAADPGSVMMFMLDGAEDLGAAGVDLVYGHGLLDIAGAIDNADAAIGSALIPTATGQGTSLASSALWLGPAFGDALAGNGLLDRSIAVITLSDGEHPYRARLGDTVTIAERNFGLDALLATEETRRFALPIGNGLSLLMAVAGDPARPVYLSTHPPDPLTAYGRDTAHSMLIAGALGDGTDIRLGLDGAAAGPIGTGAIAERADTLFWSTGETITPLSDLAGQGAGLGIDQALGGSTILSLGLFEGETNDTLGTRGSYTRLGQISVTHDFAIGATVRVDLGTLEESSAFLGSQGGGAFASDDGAASEFITVGASLQLSGRVDLLGSLTLATTEMADQQDSVLGGWDDIRSNAFALGTVVHDILADSDQLGLMIGQPLRVADAEVTVTVPVALAADGSVVRETDRINLTPEGREIDLQLAYQRALAPGMETSSWLMMRREPGHVETADTAYGIGLSFRLKF